VSTNAAGAQVPALGLQGRAGRLSDGPAKIEEMLGLAAEGGGFKMVVWLCTSDWRLRHFVLEVRVRFAGWWGGEFCVEAEV